MRVQVECYSAYRAEERPVRFRIEGREYRVEEVLDRWYGPNHSWYKVLGNDGNVYFYAHLSQYIGGRNASGQNRRL